MIKQKEKQSVFEELKHWYTPFHVVMNHAGLLSYETRVVEDISQLSTVELQKLKEDLHRFRNTVDCFYT